jgi:hypothetical protein
MFFVHIDVKTFMKRESQAGNEMIKMDGVNPNLWVFFQNSMESLLFLLTRGKTFLATKDLSQNSIGMDFGRPYRERISRCQVPGITGELALNVDKESWRPEDFQGLLSV